MEAGGKEAFSERPVSTGYGRGSRFRHEGRRDGQGLVNVDSERFHEGRGAGKSTTPGGRESMLIFSKNNDDLTAESSGVGEKKGIGGCRAVLGRSFTGSMGYGWTGQRKSAEEFLVTVTVPALCAARTAAWDVRSTGVVSGLSVTRKTFQWPP